ncbi:SIR2 family protein [Levilactobacillus lanxiensis]|uniref:SIR2 family protein n=1 Tax=Levilactobacillus lanxiensis TaxID=2799568 RepID=A0ABW4D8R4_9LACO|nr:SIR2 family protein [Levilactobacillus lanxiensis]
MDNQVDTLSKRMRNLAITKQLNFLLGSGTSVPAIPLMAGLTNSELLKKVEVTSREILDRYRQSANVRNTQSTYDGFIQVVIDLLNLSNSRQSPKNVNIFTTNYDLFIEKAIDKASKNNRIVFNDGANGYFQRMLDSSNYNRTVSYRGLNNDYLNEVPSISVIKPHGSMNWVKEKENIRIINRVSPMPVVVPPTGLEAATTFLQNHFYEMLRIFQLELDKPQSVLFIIGFSFQDKHIGKMVRRALQNAELMVYAIGYSDADRGTFLNNLGFLEERPNFKIITPKDVFVDKNSDNLNLEWLTRTLNGMLSEGD